MPGNKILSRDFVIAINIEGTYYPVFCAKSGDFSVEQEAIEVTTVTSGIDREYTPGLSSSTLSVSGITTLDNTDGRLSLNYLLQASKRRAIHSFRILQTDESGTQLQMTFNAFLVAGSLSKEVPNWSESNASFQVTGPVTYSSIISSPATPICEVQEPLYLTTVAGEHTVSDIRLKTETGYTKTILLVEREGLGHDETSGTPGNRMFRYTANGTTGTIEFDASNPFNSGEIIFILFKKQTA